MWSPLMFQTGAGYTTVPLAVLNSVVMMVGDMDYLDTFVSPHIDGDVTTSPFSGMAFFIMSMFLLLMSILLMNLLVSSLKCDSFDVQILIVARKVPSDHSAIAM